VGQPVAEGIGGGISPAPGVDFGVNITDVALDSAYAQEQIFGNIAVTLASSNKAQHLNLALGQAVGVCWGCLWRGDSPLLEGQHSLGKGTYAQLLGNGNGLIQQGNGPGLVARIVTLD
jgi:hypothetical protein